MPNTKISDLTLGTAAEFAAGAGVPASVGTSVAAKRFNRQVLRDAILNAAEEARFAGAQIFSPRNAVVCLFGDSNTQGRPWFRQAYLADWFAPGGIYEGATYYNAGANGATCAAWVGTIAGGLTSDPPVDKNDVATGLNIWQIVNAKPNVVHFQIGTNDFRVNAGPALLAAVTATFKANLKTIIDFLLANTTAEIVLSIPQPIAYANPDPNPTFTDSVDANDTAARSAAMRESYLIFVNYSSRVKVWDSHKHLFGYRADSIAAPQDPEGFGNLLDDTLHTTALGATRKVQYLGRALRPSQRASSSYLALPLIIANSFWSVGVVCTDTPGGAGYFYLKDNQQEIDGSLSRVAARPSLDNIGSANSIVHAGAGRPFSQLRSLGKNWSIYSHTTGVTVNVTNTKLVLSYRSGNFDFECTAAGVDFTGISGVCTIYTSDVGSAPNYLRETMPRFLSVNGPQPLAVGAEGRMVTGFNASSAILLGVNGTRSNAADILDVTLYVQNQVTGDYNDGVVVAANPGKPIGVLSFGLGFKNSPTWTWDATYYPSGGFVFNEFYILCARITAGAAGNSCELALIFA